MFAHSPPKDDPTREPHLYVDHVREVEGQGLDYLNQILEFSNLPTKEVERVRESLRLALQVHDIGKLEPDNQQVLSGQLSGRLAYDHVDGGVAVALDHSDLLAAWLIRAHHAPGLANLSTEKSIKRLYGLADMLRGQRWNRDGDAGFQSDHLALVERTDSIKDQLKQDHEQICQHKLVGAGLPEPNDSLLTRFMLSCLVDADHGDTGNYYSQSQYISRTTDTRWSERLERLVSHVSNLDSGEKERKKLRDELFDQCLNFPTNEKIVACPAPVGLGKTTSVIAYLLRCARDRNLRRIFVIAPFTNVISQTARNLRNALVLDGEDPELVVAEHHHRVEFASAELRKYTELWRAPIIVTTAVQFFETIASANPTALRKFHAVPGSAIFVDECHACVPVELMKQTWIWLAKLGDEWGCHMVLASGSLSKFWEREEIVGKENTRRIPSLLSEQFSEIAKTQEYRRVAYRKLNDGNPFSVESLINKVESSKYETSTCLVILNTVRSAVSIAKRLQPPNELHRDLQDRTVLHLSTALTPKDRERVIQEILRRKAKSSDWKNKGWILVATSCVEAGVDLDFDIGFRERFSLTSFLQTSGRINREGLNVTSELFDFVLTDDESITKHPGATIPSQVFELAWPYLTEGQMELDELSTKALISEATKKSDTPQIRSLFNDECNCNFQNVQRLYKIIQNDTCTVIIDENVSDRLRQGIPTSFHEIQASSVQIWANRIRDLGLTPIDIDSNIFEWPFGYDANFLGYMENPDIFKKGIGWFV